MILTYLGHSCFKIQDKTGTDGVTVLTDPFSFFDGFKKPSLEADIVTIGHDKFNEIDLQKLRKQPFVVNEAGEFDVKGILVEGIDASKKEEGKEKYNKELLYRIEVEDVSIAHLGNLSHVLDSKHLDHLNRIDILLVPVGGNGVLDASKAAELVSLIEPRMVIPMYYNSADLKQADSLEKFIKEIGLKPTYEEEKLKINKKDLPQEDMELVIIKN